MISCRVECLESVALGDDDDDDEMSGLKERPHHDLLYSKAITSLPFVSPPDSCGSRWSRHGVPFRSVWFGQLWRGRVWLQRTQCSRVGKFRHVAIVKAALAWPTPVARPGSQDPTSKEACAFMTHPRKGMTLDACSLGNSHDEEAGSCPPSTRVWREPRRCFRRLISVYRTSIRPRKRRVPRDQNA